MSNEDRIDLLTKALTQIMNRAELGRYFQRLEGSGRLETEEGQACISHLLSVDRDWQDSMGQLALEGVYIYKPILTLH